VVLKSPYRTITIDAKFYKSPLVSQYEGDRYHSDHLYQLFAYLRNAKTKGPEYEGAEGILLYGEVGTKLDETFEVQGHPIRVYSLDLNQEWQGIHEDLLSLTAA
jgi:5-methylcytosine-specific restriction enzyme subunit McrC